MKKITAVIGSPHVETSNTCTLTRSFLEMVREEDPTIEYEIISLGSLRIEPCHGCWACTKMGNCVLKDDLPGLLQKLSDSDMIILGSPVYVDHISAQTKAFVDRIFIWLHTLRLIGKPSLSVVTTAGSLGSSQKYLDEVLYLLGTIPMGHLRGIAYQPGVFPGLEDCRKKYRPLAKKVARVLNGREALRPRLFNHLCFLSMRAKAHYGAAQLPYENRYWKEKGWDRCGYVQAARLEREMAENSSGTAL